MLTQQGRHSASLTAGQLGFQSRGPLPPSAGLWGSSSEPGRDGPAGRSPASGSRHTGRPADGTTSNPSAHSSTERPVTPRAGRGLWLPDAPLHPDHAHVHKPAAPVGTAVLDDTVQPEA